MPSSRLNTRLLVATRNSQKGRSAGREPLGGRWQAAGQGMSIRTEKGLLVAVQPRMPCSRCSLPRQPVRISTPPPYNNNVCLRIRMGMHVYFQQVRRSTAASSILRAENCTAYACPPLPPTLRPGRSQLPALQKHRRPLRAGDDDVPVPLRSHDAGARRQKQ